MQPRIFVALVMFAIAAASPMGAERLPLRNYRSSEGLPHDRVKSIVRDSRGFLWFCTVEGLAQFDGDRFTRFGLDDGLPSRSVNDIIEASPGIYWIAPNGGGLSHFVAATRRFTTIRLTESFLSNRVNTVLLDRDARLWAATDDGLFSFDTRAAAPAVRREELAAEAGPRIVRLLNGSDGSVWIATPRALIQRLPDGVQLTYTVAGRGWPTEAMVEDAAGRLWAGGANGLAVFEPRANTTARVIEDIGAVGAIVRRSDGALVVGTIAGDLVEIDGERRAHYTVAHGLQDSAILSLAEDAARNLWFGTFASGAFRLARNGLVTYGRSNGLVVPQIAALLEDRRGRLVVATYDGRLSQFDGEQFRQLQLPTPGPSSFIGDVWQQFVLQSRSGDWWLRTPAGTFRMRAREDAPAAVIQDFGRSGGLLPAHDIRRIFEDHRGHVWLGMTGPDGAGLAELDPSGALRVFSAKDGLPASGYVSAFGEDRFGTLWIGFSEDGGLARYRDRRFERWTKDADVPAGNVRAVFRDRRNSLWVAGDVGGLRRITGEDGTQPRFERWTVAEGLASNNTRAIAEDADGRLYVGTALGVDRIDVDRRMIRHYTTADGLASNEVDVALTARDGSIWFGTRNGLSRLVPGEARETPTAVWIRTIRIADAPFPIDALGAAHVVVPPIEPGDNRIDIEFGGLEFGTKGAVRYEYRLGGIDRSWQPASGDRRVAYARLGAGRYRFEVRAIGETGAVSEQPALVEFAIRPPVWQRAWFLSLSVMVVLLAAYGFHRLRVARLLDIERMRLRIATDLHDDIGASLSRIAILSEVARRDVAAGPGIDGPLARIAATSREVVDAMNDIVWAINPHRDSLEDLTGRMRRFANDVLVSRGIELRFGAPPEGLVQHIGHDVRRELLLVLKESVANIGRHAACTEAFIELRASRGTLVLVVRDNGRGFDVTAAHAGHGLANMRRRIERLGGTIDLRSTPGAGTELIATVPLRHYPHR